MPKVPLICPTCQTEFLVSLRGKKRKYCSPQCHQKRTPRILVVCEYCEKERLFQPNEVKNGRKYCSKACEIRGRKSHPVLQRIEKHLDRTSSPNGCWLWMGSLSNGYGYVKRGGEGPIIKVVRVLWEQEHGPVPHGMKICHDCPGGKDHKACCRPSHMFLGNHAANMADAAKKGIMPRGSHHHNARLTESWIIRIRELSYVEHLTNSEIARQFDVSISHVSAIVRRKTWKHVV